MIRQDKLTPTTIKKINSFWNWFSSRELELMKAVEQKENYEWMLNQLNKKLKTISTRLGFVIKAPKNPQEKYTIIFTAHGQRTLFGKVNGLEQLAPDFKNWKPQAFIKQVEDIEKFKKGLDDPFIFQDFEIKTSALYFAVLDYNIDKKKLKIIIYLNNYRFHFDNDFLQEAIYIMLENLIGEIALNRNITLVQLAQLPNNPKNLIHLIEIQQYIEILNNARKKSVNNFI